MKDFLRIMGGNVKSVCKWIPAIIVGAIIVVILCSVGAGSAYIVKQFISNLILQIVVTLIAFYIQCGIVIIVVKSIYDYIKFKTLDSPK